MTSDTAATPNHTTSHDFSLILARTIASWCRISEASKASRRLLSHLCNPSRKSGIGVLLPPFDSLRSLMAGPASRYQSLKQFGVHQVFVRSESNALSKRSASKGQTLPARACAYLLKFSDGSLYAGSTADLQARVERHNAGLAATWTKAGRPVDLVEFEEFPTRGQAIRRERQWKGWTHAKKEALIAGDVARLKALSKSRARIVKYQ